MSDIRYYNKELDIDGTAKELFLQVSKGYFDDNTEAMNKISEFLDGEGMGHEARYVRANILFCNEERLGQQSDPQALAFYTFLMDLEIFKAENLPDYPVPSLEHEYSDQDIHRSITGLYDKKEDRITCAVVESSDDGHTRTNSSSFSYDMIKDMIADDFDKTINAMLFYSQEMSGEEMDLE